jgi:hypothetical protein
MNPNQSLAPVLQKKHHYLGPIIVFIFCEIIFYRAGLISGQLFSTYIIGTIIISLIITGLFSLVAYLIRKISVRFGRFIGLISWALVIILIIGGGWLFIQNNRVYTYTTPGVILQSDHKISLQECLTTTDQAIKQVCGMNYAVQMKDRSICQQVYGNTDKAYYCQGAYDSQYGYVPPSISQCQNMTASEANGSFYKDNCFRGIAETNLDPSICKYLSAGKQDACVVQVNNDAYAKKNLCGPLFVNNNIPGAGDCLKYVESLRNANACKLLTRAQGPLPDIINECISVANQKK